jgi:hypothetical protein
MAETIDQLAQPVRIFLVDTAQDYDKFLPLLEKLVEEHSANELFRNSDDYKHVQYNIDIAFNCLGDKEARKFLIMFAWSENNQVFLPFSSGLFDDDEIDTVHNIVKTFIKVALQLDSSGFEFRSLNENNKLLSMLIQVLCENELMQLKLDYYQNLN